MMFPPLLATTISADTSFEWPIVVAVGTLFLWAGRQQATLAQQQTELARAHSENSAVKKELADHKEQERNTREKDRAEILALTVRTSNMEVLLGRMDQMMTDIHGRMFKHKESA